MWIFVLLSALIILILFMIMPSLRHHPGSDDIKRLYVAHRGLHSLSDRIPENSLSAYRNAVRHGYAIEIDIHITRDGRVAVFHDDTLNRVCGIDGSIEEMTADELKSLRLIDTDEQIPMLEDVLKTVDGKSLLVIEYKCTEKNYKPLCESADRLLSQYSGKYIVQSFNPFPMYWFRRNRPEICRGQLSSDFIRQTDCNFLRAVVGFLLVNIISRPDFISYDIKYTNAPQRRICAFFGAGNAGWTFRNQEDLDKYRDKYGIIIFENFMPKK